VGAKHKHKRKLTEAEHKLIYSNRRHDELRQYWKAQTSPLPIRLSMATERWL